MSYEFSGATPPAGVAPWLTATFDDENSPGTVKFTLTTTNLTGTEFVREFDFNLNPIYDPATALSLSAPTKTGTFTSPAISQTLNGFKADGDGKYDIQLAFATGGGTNGRFGVGEAVEYVITGIGAAAGVLVAGDFVFLSEPDGGHGPFVVAAHVQSIGTSGNDSGWITVPEPAAWTLIAWAMSLTALRRVH